MDQQFRPGTGAEPTTTIEISISCQNILDKDLFSRSDPMCVVYTQPWGIRQWGEFLRTEVVWDNLNPEFTTKVKMDYRFEEEQPLRFVIYDNDALSHKLEDHDYLGFAETTVARVVSAGYHGLVLPLCQEKSKKYVNNQIQGKPQRNTGTITLIAEELVQLKEEVILELGGSSMGSSFLGCCAGKIFYTISKVTEGGKSIIVHKSEFSPGTNPLWKPLNVSISSLCNGDKDRGLKIECYQEGFNGYHTLIGSVSATVNRLMASAGGNGENLFLSDPSGTKLTSCLIVTVCKVTPIFTFVDYIRGGTQIHCCFAIDMTGSNGDPNDPSSLHYINPANVYGNPYQQAIQAVGEIVQEYDHTKAFPAYGFGARIPPSGFVSHKLNLNIQSGTPFCTGISGVLETYKSCINQVQLWGPTNFSPIIREAANMALQNANGPHYYVLLMITDGIISDMDETTQAIVNASTLPLSIIIVGVGGANFDAMDVLDGDTVRLSYNGRAAARDIVQFVPYRDAFSWISSVAPAVANQRAYAMVGSDPSQANRVAKAKLAQEVLAEIPGQLTSYMKSRGIVPGNIHSASAPTF